MLLRFALNLEEHDLPDLARHPGPLFHRWLPDGMTDSIELQTSDPSSRLSVWFERRGFSSEGSEILFDIKRKEVPSDAIPLQAVLEAGPLFGQLALESVTAEEERALVKEQVGEEPYVGLGKRVVKGLIPALQQFIAILRTNYGQYWVRELDDWDSRRQSLGAFCQLLELGWSLDGGTTWKPFLPDKAIHSEVVVLPRKDSFLVYLQKDDWKEIAGVAESDYTPSLGARMVANTHALLDQHNLRFAFIEGVEALEIALGEYVRRTIFRNPKLEDVIQGFWNLTLPARTTVVVSLADTGAKEDLEETLEAIKTRNRIVHEGSGPSEHLAGQVGALLRVASSLLEGPKFRFPSAAPGQAILSLENWDSNVDA